MLFVRYGLSGMTGAQPITRTFYVHLSASDRANRVRCLTQDCYDTDEARAHAMTCAMEAEECVAALEAIEHLEAGEISEAAAGTFRDLSRRIFDSGPKTIRLLAIEYLRMVESRVRRKTDVIGHRAAPTVRLANYTVVEGELSGVLVSIDFGTQWAKRNGADL